MIPHGEQGRLRREHPILARVEDRAATLRQGGRLRRAGRVNDFGGPQSLQFGEQGRFALRLGGLEIAGGQIHRGQAEHFSARINGRQEIISIRRQQPLVEMGARAENLRDLALDDLAGAGLLQLLANRHLASGLEQARDVAAGGVEGDAAHGRLPAFGQGDVEQLRAGAGVLEEQLVKIAQAEEQQGFGRQFAFDAAVLRHHGRQLCRRLALQDRRERFRVRTPGASLKCKIKASVRLGW